MGQVVTGDLDEIRFTHPTLGSGVFYPKANEDYTLDLGGLRNEDDKNLVDGGGRQIIKKNRNLWSFEGPGTWDMNTVNEVDLLVKLAEDPDPANWTVQHSNKTVWGGKGIPVGDIEGNSNAGTFTLKLAGAGKLKKIVG